MTQITAQTNAADTPDLHRNTRALLGALLWLFCFQFFVAEQVARLFFRGSYSMARNMISDLGALHCPGAGIAGCSPLHGLMNASFMLQGLLIMGGAWLTRRLFPSNLLASAAFLLLGASGLGLLGVGLVPEDAVGDLHVLAATVHFLCGSLAMLLLGFALVRRSQSTQTAGLLTVGAGMLSFAATVMLGYSMGTDWGSLGWPAGAVERLAAYPLPLWLTVTGCVLLRQVRKRPLLAGRA